MNYHHAKCQLIKGALFTAGIGIGIASLYTLSHMYQKSKTVFDDYKESDRLHEYIKTDSRFTNGVTLTKFCMDVHNNMEQK